MKKILWVLAVIILLGISNNAYANLLTNPGFETPMTATEQVPGWVVPTWAQPNMWQQTGIHITDVMGNDVVIAAPAAGNWNLECFWNGQAMQTVGVTAGTTYRMSIDTWMDNNEGALATFIPAVRVLWFASGSTTVLRNDVVADMKALARETWVHSSANLVAPATAAYARVLLDVYWLTNVNPGYEPANPTGFDNADFDVVPEPSSLLLLGTGIIGMLTSTRRKKKA